MRLALHYLKLTGVAFSAFALVALFQNCSPHSGSKSGGVDGMSTGGVDGMKYDRAGLCPDGNRTNDTIALTKDMQSAAYIRRDCKDLSTPEPVAVGALNFAVNETSVFVLNEAIYAIKKDGSEAAPVGNSPFPNLLANYSIRPDWKVAGVDYALGPASTTQFKNPTTISIPGATVDLQGHQIVINADNITLDGYDFSLDGGWTVVVGEQQPAANTKILNSKFKVGSNKQPMLDGANDSTNLYIGYCVFDGNDTQDSLASSSIFFFGSGMTVEYSWFKNSPEDFIQAGAGTIVIRYNVFNNNGQEPGTAADWLQLGSGNHYLVADFNTFYQTAALPGNGGTAGISVVGQTGSWTIQSAEVMNNTIITESGAQVSTDVSIGITGLLGTSIVRDNFIDPSGSTAFAAQGSSCTLGACPASANASSIFTNNVNLMTGVSFPSNP